MHKYNVTHMYMIIVAVTQPDDYVFNKEHEFSALFCLIKIKLNL